MTNLRRPRTTTQAIVLTLGLLVLLGGCTPWATYPKIQGAAGIDDPNLSPIPDLMADAIDYAYDQDGAPEPLVFNLPEGTPASVYDKVSGRLRNGYAMSEPRQRAYHVREVRVRTLDAQVDLIHPSSSGTPQLMTISFDRHLGGNTVTHVRYWHLRVDTPRPGYYDPDADLPAIVYPVEHADASSAGAAPATDG